MSAAASFIPRYTPAQLEAHRRIQAIRAKQKAAMLARLRAEEEAKRAAIEARLEAERRAADYKAKLAERRFQAAQALSVARSPESRPYGGLLIAKVRFDDALARVSEAYGIPEEVILSPSRMTEVCTARTHLTVLLAKENPYSSLPALGRALGRDHTTVMHSIRRWNSCTGENVRMLGPDNRRSKFLHFKPVEERLMVATA